MHLRCGYFTTNLLTDLERLRAGGLSTIRQLDAPMPWVDPRDIAAVAALRLLLFSSGVSRGWRVVRINTRRDANLNRMSHKVIPCVQY